MPKVRQWVLAKTMPTLRQTWPRLIEVLGQPWRLALAVGGNLLMTLGFIFAFDASLAAFGQEASLIQVALVYLAGNTAGALVPTPGGMGTIELALAGALTSITGINAGIATSIAVLFRVVTYWLRIPIGWVAMRYLQKTRRASSTHDDLRAGTCAVPARRVVLVRGQASALALSWSNSFWSIVPASSSALASVMCSAGDLPAGDLADVAVGVRLGLLHGLHLPLRHPLAPGDDVDQGDEERDDDQDR